MKIAFILIVHLGLVACAKSPQDFKAERCQAITELNDYFWKARDDTKGTILSGMLDRYVRQGVITKVDSDGFKKEIPLHVKDQMLDSLATKIENFIKSKTCICSGNVGKNDTVGIVGSNAAVGITGLNITADIIRLNAEAEVVKLDAKAGTIRLNVKAGSIKLNTTAEKDCLIFTCLTCNAIDQILNYMTDDKDDPNGAAFWGLMTKFTNDGMINSCEYERFKQTLHHNKVEKFRDGHFRTASFEVINYLKVKSQANCCGKVGSNATAGNATEFKCELDTSKEKTAIQQLKKFIKKNDHSSEEIVTMVNNFYVEGSISGFERGEYRKMVEGELNGKPRKLAERVLEDVLRNYGLIQIYHYEKKVVHSDNRGTILFGLLKELENEGLMTGPDYNHCQNLFSGAHYGKPGLLAGYVRNNLRDGEYSEICKRRI